MRARRPIHWDDMEEAARRGRAHAFLVIVHMGVEKDGPKWIDEHAIELVDELLSFMEDK